MPRRPFGRPFIALGAAALVALAGAGAYACQPCESTLDLRRTLEKADLVVVAGRAKLPKEPDGPGGGSACHELEVEAVLKGEFKGEKLTVRRWYGMCPYGIFVNEGTYVVILGKASASDYDSTTYDDGECRESLGVKAHVAKAPEGKSLLFVPVEHGCAVKTLRVESGSVEAEGVRMTLEEFRGKYGLAAGAAGARHSAAGVYAWAGFPSLAVWPRLF